MEYKSLMSGWINPYTELQKQFRAALRDTLRRSHPVIARDQFLNCVTTEDPQAQLRVLQKLFNNPAAQRLEWKTGISSAEILQRKMAGVPNINREAAADLYHTSQELAQRTKYPFIAPSDHEAQLVSHFNGKAPVFGVNILVRPPCQFSRDRPGNDVRHNLEVGRNEYLLALHGNFEGVRLKEDGAFKLRLVAGDAFRPVFDQIWETATDCSVGGKPALREGNIEGAVLLFAAQLNRFGRKAAVAQGYSI